MDAARDDQHGPDTTEAGSESGRLFHDVRSRLFGPAKMPETIGPYRVLRRIGVGGMGLVYEAVDPQLGRRVAVKVLFRQNARADARFRREARALARLSHANVVAIYEVGRCEHGEFIAMEFVEGVTLRRWMESRRTPPEIAEVMRQAGEGLVAAHRAGLVHRDFKPDNVLVGHDGRVRVADFGLAKGLAQPQSSPDVLTDIVSDMESGGLWTDLTRTGTTMGTPAYMAPEQFLGLPACARTDQFAFCVVAFEALCGCRPFPADSLPEALARINAGDIAPVPGDRDVPKALYAAIERGLRADADRRFPKLEPLLAALRATAKSTPSTSRRARWAWLAALVGAVTALVGASRAMPQELADSGEVATVARNFASTAALVPALPERSDSP